MGQRLQKNVIVVRNMMYKDEILINTRRLGAMLRKAPDQRYALIIARGYLKFMAQREIDTILFAASVFELSPEDLTSFLKLALLELRKITAGVSFYAQGYTGCFIRFYLDDPVMVEEGVLVRLHFSSSPKFICLN